MGPAELLEWVERVGDVRHALVDPGRITPHGGFWFQRTGPGRGQCSRGYPCHHPGEDWRPAGADRRVVAPERCTVEALGTDRRPLTGYGDTAALVRGWRVWHVLGDLSELAPGLRIGDELGAGDLVGYCGSFCHWEVRTVATPPTGEARRPFVLSASAWLRSRRRSAELLELGALVGLAAVGTVAASLVVGRR